MKTDYSILNKEKFEKSVRSYLAYLVYNGLTDLVIHNKGLPTGSIELMQSSWKEFSLNELFIPKRGTRLTKEDRISGDIPLVTAGEGNLGVKELISNEDQERFTNKITIDMFCNSYTHEDEFCCDDNIIALESKEEISKFSKLFINTVIELDKCRYQYGRQYRMKNFKNHTIRLPQKNDGTPDWEFMAKFIKQLPYSDRI